MSRRRPPDPSAVNPFSPAPGRAPFLLAGRERELADYQQALTQGPAHPSFFSYLIGARGYGKTVMLREFGRRAQEAGWTVIVVDAATGGLHERLRTRIVRAFLTEATKNRQFRRLLPELVVGVPGLATLRWHTNSLDPEAADIVDQHLDVRAGLDLLAAAAAKRGAGVLLGVDELHDAVPDEVRRIGNDIQLVQGDDSERWISFIGAGLPDLAEPDGLLDHVSTFLHRGRRVDIAELTADDAAMVLRVGFQQAGLTVDPAVVAEGVAIANGHPWYLQLVGYHAVDAMRQVGGSHLTVEIARTGFAEANDRTAPILFEPVWHRLSGGDQAMMTAVADEGGTSTVSRVRDRLGWSRQMVNQYRARLIERGLLSSPRRAEVAFTHRQALDWLHVVLEPFEGEPFSDDPPEDAKPDLHAPGGEQAAQAHRAMVNSLPPAPRASRCGVYGPRSKAPCIRPAGHKGQHRYR